MVNPFYLFSWSPFWDDQLLTYTVWCVNPSRDEEEEPVSPVASPLILFLACHPPHLFPSIHTQLTHQTSWMCVRNPGLVLGMGGAMPPRMLRLLHQTDPASFRKSKKKERKDFQIYSILNAAQSNHSPLLFCQQSRVSLSLSFAVHTVSSSFSRIASHQKPRALRRISC